MSFFDWQDMESAIFQASLVAKKCGLLDLLGKKKQVRQRGWLQFQLIPAGCWLEEFPCDNVDGPADHLGLRYVCELQLVGRGKIFLQLAVD